MSFNLNKLPLLIFAFLFLSIPPIIKAEESPKKTESAVSENKTGESDAAKAATPAPKRFVINGMTVTFTGENEATVEANGQIWKINTAQQNVFDLNGIAAQPATDAPAAPATPAPAGQNNDATAQATDNPTEPTEADEIDPESYYGYELVNLPTPKRYEKGAFSVHFTHRFGQTPFNKSFADLFGLDSFSASGLGFSYGLTDRLFVKIYRTPVDRTIEIGGGAQLLHQNEKVPVSAMFYASVEGRDNFDFNEPKKVNFSGIFGRAFSRYGSAFFAPTVSLNNNPNFRFDRSQSNTTVSYGFGGQINFRPTASFIMEFVPRSGYKIPNSVSAVSFGIQKRTYRHVFTLTLSNTQFTTTSQYNAGFGTITDRKLFANGLTIGFNIYRRFF